MRRPSEEMVDSLAEDVAMWAFCFSDFLRTFSVSSARALPLGDL